jgi:hypothetical protein
MGRIVPSWDRRKEDPMMIRHDAERDSFADGLEEASRLCTYFTMRDPVLLKAAADALEGRASSPFESGLICGLRLTAIESLDRERFG